MCGRFTLTVSLEQLLVRYDVHMTYSISYHHPQYNVAPTQQVLAIIHDGTRNRLGELKWGLVPSWAKEPAVSGKMINARSETLAHKPAFKLPFERKRCIIPADSFYEWQLTAESKQPYRIGLKDGGIFSLAGLYDTWTNPDGTKLSSCTIITTSANSLMAPIHDRMPVILPQEAEDEWLRRDNHNIEALQQLLVPYPAEEMKAYPVSTLVNSVKNNSPACIEALPS
ncbi:SOS response-associated peptidase [Paenibacillus sediminis]|uniref:Abasic site processing protein n=1 Tax=Paenibacillus sediminis TaxID=664909 RepID=A0ABS4GZ86_9BACL|nr:SOS response-associated peptidase [Paenibacillus sediminis]MBP1935585.1 putative SOS response-associated peptidase YedK [Paenibacillus sediminis]